MASAGDFVSDFSPRERAVLDAALREGEQVRWAVRPLRRFSTRELVGFVFIELFAAAFLTASSVLACMLVVHPPSKSLGHRMVIWAFLSLFFLHAIFCALYPLWKYRRRRHTLYLLTNHRALVLTPGGVQAYPLHEHMLRSLICRPGGAGDLLFEEEKGFTHLPDLLRAHRELNEAVAALLDAAEQRPGGQIKRFPAE